MSRTSLRPISSRASSTTPRIGISQRRCRKWSQRSRSASRAVAIAPASFKASPSAPSTFSGGEQQRVNIARGFLPDLPLLLLDEPTASLDAANRAVVVSLIDEKKRKGVAMVAIVHDDDVREKIADRTVDVTQFAAAA